MIPNSCNTCRYSYRGDYTGWHCEHPTTKKFDVVTGWDSIDARDARKVGATCGPDGSLWAEYTLPTDWMPLILGVSFSIFILGSIFLG